MDDDWGYPYFRKPPYVAVQFTHPAPPNSQLATSLNMVYCSLDKLSPIIPQSTILGLKRYLYEWKTLVLLLFTPKQLGSMDVHTQNICFVIFARVKIWCMDWWPPLLSVVTHPNLSSQMPMSLDWFKGSTRIYRKPSHFQGNTMPIGSMYGIYAKMTGVYWWQMLPYMAYIRILWGNTMGIRLFRCGSSGIFPRILSVISHRSVFEVARVFKCAACVRWGAADLPWTWDAKLVMAEEIWVHGIPNIMYMGDSINGDTPK